MAAVQLRRLLGSTCLMRKSTAQAVLSILLILLTAAAVGWAGSQDGQRAAGVPVFVLCGTICFALNWLVFIHAYAAQTERYFDLTGSLTYLSVVACAVALGNRDPRALLLAVLVGVWALRLGTFLFRRIRREGADRRFDTLKPSFPRFLLTWTLQGLWVFLTVACALAAITAADGRPLGALAALGTVVWIAGFAIEAIADRQKAIFRSDPANRDRFITTGLWAWSRHPNYCGEILLWIGVALVAVPALSGWQLVTLISPVFVYVLLTRISGIPLLESRSDEKWAGDSDYRGLQGAYPGAVAPTPVPDVSDASVRHPPLRLITYALPSLVSSVAALPLVLFVPAFYADDLGVPLAAVGFAIAASRLLDVVTDPLIGIASDRLGLAWGRRKPWIVLGTPLFAVSLWQLFVPGQAASVGSLLGWSALLYLGFTMIDLPHKAWGAELSSDYDERSRITSWREGLSTGGQVVLLAALVGWGARGVSDAADQLRGIALVVVIALPLLVAAAVLMVPEGRREGFAHERRGIVGGPPAGRSQSGLPPHDRLRRVLRFWDRDPGHPASARPRGRDGRRSALSADAADRESRDPRRGSRLAAHLARNREAPRARGRRTLARGLQRAARLPARRRHDGADRPHRDPGLELRLDPLPLELHRRGRDRRGHAGVGRAALGALLRRLGHDHQALPGPRRAARNRAARGLRLRPDRGGGDRRSCRLD